jgi:hypothetical protein
VKLTALEASVLGALMISADGNGNDFSGAARTPGRS